MPNFIKQDYTEKGEVQKGEFLPKEILTFAISLLILSALFYAGVLYQQRLVRSDIEQTQIFINAIDKSRDKEEEQRILAFAGQLDNLDSFLKSRLYPSKFLKAVEETAQPQVSYTDLALDLERQTFELKGQATRYGVLAKQMVKLSEVPVFSNIVLPETLVQVGGVSFTLRGSVSLDYFKSTDSLPADQLPGNK